LKKKNKISVFLASFCTKTIFWKMLSWKNKGQSYS
jgi:hypothetical protein